MKDKRENSNVPIVENTESITENSGTLTSALLAQNAIDAIVKYERIVQVRPITDKISSSYCAVPTEHKTSREGNIKLAVEFDVEFDETVKGMTGKKYSEMTKIEKREFITNLMKMRVVINASSGLDLDISDAEQHMQFLILKYNKNFIDESSLPAYDKNNLPSNIKYIFVDEENSINKILKGRELKKEAGVIVSKMNINQKRKILRTFGYNVENVSDLLIEKWIGDEEERNPTKVLSIAKSPYRYEMEFLYALKEARLFVDINGLTKYNDIVVGFGDEECVRFLTNKENSDIIFNLKKAINW